MQLNANGLRRIFKEGAKPLTFQPLVQVLDISAIKSGTRVVISDSLEFTQCLLRNSTEEMQGLKYAVIFLKDYQLITVEGVLLLLIIDFEVVSTPGIVLGKPQLVEYKSDLPTQVKNITYDLEEIAKKKIPTPTSSAKKQVDSEDLYAPIRALSLTNSDWTIKARVIQKSTMRNYTNMKGPGKVFNCVLMDSCKDEIQGTFFNQAADRFYDMLIQGHVYSFSGGYIKSSNRRFSVIDSDIEISFEKNSMITELADDGRIATVGYNFVPIDHLPKCGINSLVDVCGFITEMDQVTRITSKKGENLIKRTITIMDHTEHSIEVTLWDRLAQMPEFDTVDVDDKPIIALKFVKITDFNKISLSSDRNATSVVINFTGHENAEHLANWKRSRQKIYPSTPLSERKSKDSKFKTTAEIKNEWESNLSMDKTEFFRIIGNVGKISIEEDRFLWYESCPNNTCKKKVTQDSFGKYNCETCNKTFESCQYRYLTNLAITDCTGTIYVTAFDDIMNEFLECTAPQLHEAYTTSPEVADKITFNAFGRLVDITVNAKAADNKNGYKFTAKRIDKLDCKAITNMLLREINMINN